jgi:hypothetical protein
MIFFILSMICYLYFFYTVIFFRLRLHSQHYSLLALTLIFCFAANRHE